MLTGPSSRQLIESGRSSQRALAETQSPLTQSWQREAIDSLGRVCLCLDSEYPVYTKQKVSLRQWSRDLIWLRNRTRGHGAPKSTALSTCCLDLRTSIEVVARNAPAFARSWAHLRRGLSGKYRVSCFGGDPEPFSYLAREREHNLIDGTYVFLDIPRPAQLLLTDPDLSDFLLPNGNFRAGRFETLSYITDDRRQEDGSAFTLPATATPVSETGARPDLDLIGEVFTNMPPRRDRYVRRESLEEELETLLLDDRHPVITLQGRGGIGKTSLALEVLHKIAVEGKVFAIVWFSARDIDLLSHGPKIVRPDVMSTRDIAADFARLMQPHTTLSAEESLRYCADALSGETPDGPFIFVLDNFETIRDQADLYSFLDNASRIPNKVLITTRSREFKADYPIEVGGMTRSEFAELVRDTAARLGIGGLIHASYEEQLFDEADGHPYIAKVLLGEVAQAKRQLSLKRVVATKDAMLDALFDRSFAALSPAAQRVFLTLCSWHSLVPRIGLEAVVLGPGNERFDVELALAELSRSSLIEFSRDVRIPSHSVHPFRSNPYTDSDVFVHPLRRNS